MFIFIFLLQCKKFTFNAENCNSNFKIYKNNELVKKLYTAININAFPVTPKFYLDIILKSR